jgi:long-chain fatty acid transport protein
MEVGVRAFTQYIMGVTLYTVLIISVSLGGGYQLNEQGARAVGMGGAFVAQASDPSAVYYNPAGLTSLNGINLLAGMNFMIPSSTYNTEINTKSQVFTPVNFYGTYQVNDKIFAGLGVYNPFGLGIDWPSPLGVKCDLHAWYINPSIAYKVNDKLSVGIGVSYVYASAELTTPSMWLKGDGHDISFNFGVMYKLMDELSLGLSYRTKAEIEFSGDVKIPPSSPMTLAGKTKLPMPGNLLIGLAYDLSRDVTIEGDFQYVQWSVYDQLSISTPYGTQNLPKKWVDNVILRGGMEYKADEKSTIRGGVILDLSPQPPSRTELMLPDGDRVDISFGGSYKITEQIHVDASYMLVMFMERNATTAVSPNGPPGKYSSIAHVISVNLGYSL